MDIFYYHSLTCPSSPWLDYWWTPEIGGTELWLYYDGSYVSSSSSCGAAVAAFIRSQECWYFAGALSTSLPSRAGSYQAEVASATLAAKLTHDVLKMFGAQQYDMPLVHHCFDSQTVGHQASGDWQCRSHQHLGRTLRNMQILNEQRLGIHIFDWHIRGHAMQEILAMS